MLLGDSMIPTIESGTLIITQKEEQYLLGDIIAFVNEDGINVVHRIVEETPDGVITKGDNNRQKDPGVVTNEKILGKAVFVVPYFGFLTLFIRTPLGIVFSIILVAYMTGRKKPLKKMETPHQGVALYAATFIINAADYIITQILLTSDILFALKINIPFAGFFSPLIASTIAFAMFSTVILFLYFTIRNVDYDDERKNIFQLIFGLGVLLILMTKMLSLINILPMLVNLVEKQFLF